MSRTPDSFPVRGPEGRHCVAALTLSILLVAVGPLVLPACTSSGPSANRSTSDPAAWRPTWWIDQPIRDGASISVAAMADGPDLLSARQSATAAASAALKAALGAEPASVPESKVDTIRLPDGRHRAFVLLRGAGR